MSAEKLLVLLNSNTTLIFIAKILLKLLFSNLLHPLQLRAPHMFFSDANVFRFTLILTAQVSQAIVNF